MTSGQTPDRTKLIAEAMGYDPGGPVGLEGTNGHHSEPEAEAEAVPPTYSERFETSIRWGNAVLDKAPITWLIKDWIPHDSIGLIYGPPGCGKSFLSLALALEVARGGEFLGQKLDPATVLYVAAERGRVLGERQRAWCQYYDTDIPANFGEAEERPQIAKADGLQAVLDAIHLHRPQVVIIDTLAMVTVGVAENDGQEWGAVGEALTLLREATAGGCVIAVHHTGKNLSAGPRGHSSMEGAIDYRIEVSKSLLGGVATISAEIKKLNHGEWPLPEHYRLEPVELPLAPGELFATMAAVLMPTTYTKVATARREELLEVLASDEYIHTGASISQLCAALDVSRGTVQGAIRRLGHQIDTDTTGRSHRYHLASAEKLARANRAELPLDPTAPA
jgi:archaellum biogenesis ATPase FlaH